MNRRTDRQTHTQTDNRIHPIDMKVDRHPQIGRHATQTTCTIYTQKKTVDKRKHPNGQTHRHSTKRKTGIYTQFKRFPAQRLRHKERKSEKQKRKHKAYTDRNSVVKVDKYYYYNSTTPIQYVQKRATLTEKYVHHSVQSDEAR